MSLDHAVRVWDQGIKELARRSLNGKNKLRALSRQWDTEDSPHESLSPAGAVPIAPNSSEETSKDVTPQSSASKGEDSARKAAVVRSAEKTSKKIKESVTGLGITIEKTARQDERFQDNPVGVGCHRWFSDGSWCPTSNTFRAVDKRPQEVPMASDANNSVQSPQQDPAGSGHNGFCDTPGMKLIQDAIAAVRRFSRSFSSRYPPHHLPFSP